MFHVRMIWGLNPFTASKELSFRRCTMEGKQEADALFLYSNFVSTKIRMTQWLQRVLSLRNYIKATSFTKYLLLEVIFANIEVFYHLLYDSEDTKLLDGRNF
jgi:hypothetical protein